MCVTVARQAVPLELLSNLVYDHGAKVGSGGLPLLLLDLRWVVSHRNPVCVSCPTEQFSDFLGCPDAPPGLGRLFAHLEGQTEEGRARNAVLGPGLSPSPQDNQSNPVRLPTGGLRRIYENIIKTEI